MDQAQRKVARTTDAELALSIATDRLLDDIDARDAAEASRKVDAAVRSVRGTVGRSPLVRLGPGGDYTRDVFGVSDLLGVRVDRRG